MICMTFLTAPLQGTPAAVLPVVNGAQNSGDAVRCVRTVPVAPHVQEYVVKLTLATHPEGRENLLASKYIRYGSSPRGAQTLILGGKVRALLAGRFNVTLGRCSRAAAPRAAPSHHFKL